jgi:Fanconi anemia group M protein
MKNTQFLDIFSKEKPKKIKDNTKNFQKIHIDYREKNSLVPSELIRLGLEIEFKELKVGDYLINNTIIERKTIQDFLSSMLNKRLVKQAQEMQQYENRLIILEGIEEQELYNDKNLELNANAVRGFLLSLTLKYKIPVLFSKDSQDTAKFINLIAKKKQVESSLNVTKKSLNSSEQMQFILEGFPGIGPKTSKKLLQEFKSLNNIFNTKRENLQKLIGKKADIFDLINKEYKN